MKIPSILFVLALIFLLIPEVHSQNKRLQRAYETYEAGEYFDAIDVFKDAYQKITDKKEKVRITFFLGECCSAILCRYAKKIRGI
jgi:hypothetical protein